MTTWEYALGLMLRLVPLGTHDGAPWADESHAAQLARYENIATAVWDACGDKRGCASLLVAIAVGESGLARDADAGPRCHAKRCDESTSASVWQVKEYDGAGLDTIWADRTVAAKRVARIARGSIRMCGSGVDSLSALSGKCRNTDGPWRTRYRLWRRIQ